MRWHHSLCAWKWCQCIIGECCRSSEKLGRRRCAVLEVSKRHKTICINNSYYTGQFLKSLTCVCNKTSLRNKPSDHHSKIRKYNLQASLVAHFMERDHQPTDFNFWLLIRYNPDPISPRILIKYCYRERPFGFLLWIHGLHTDLMTIWIYLLLYNVGHCIWIGFCLMSTYVNFICSAVPLRMGIQPIYKSGWGN